MPDALLDALRDAVGPAHVLTDRDVVAGFEVDWTGRYRGDAVCVVRPADTAEVAAAVRACAAAGIPVVPQGGNTGLVGGAVPHHAVVLSLTRLQSLAPVDVAAADVVAGAGVTLAALQAHARAAGYVFPVDLAARESATVGGMVATNAGGLHAFRYGPVRRQLVGVEAVLASGDVVRRIPALAKDNTGYDLAGLLCGSEGTLGVVTAAQLRLVPEVGARVAALLGLDSTAAAVDAFARLRARVASLDAAELFFEDGLRLVCDHAALPRPLPGAHGAYLLVECAAADDPMPALAAALDGVDVADSAIAESSTERAALWAYRERHTEAIAAAGVPHKLDVAVPVSRLAAFEEAVRAALAEWRVYLFGHAGDGNLHVNVLGPDPDDDAVDDVVLRLVASFGGSISAEHGIGVAKKRWLPLVRGDADMAAMRAIKRALDPGEILNRGVLFD